MRSNLPTRRGLAPAAAALLAACLAAPQAPPTRAAAGAPLLAPEPAPSGAFYTAPGLLTAYLVRGDTVLELVVPCAGPATGTRAVPPADRELVPGRNGAAAWLWAGPGARFQALPQAAVPPRDSAVRREAASAGAYHVARASGAAGCAVGDELRVTVDSLVFPSGRFAVTGAVVQVGVAPP